MEAASDWRQRLHAGGALVDKDSKAAGSRLKGSSVVTPQKGRNYSEPNTPGSKGLAGIDDGLLSVSPEQLPANLMLLNQLLGKLLAKRLCHSCSSAQQHQALL